MNKCAILSMDNLEGHMVYDDLLHAPLKKANWEFETVSWQQQGVDWDQYNLVMIRSTWDYQLNSDKFIETLQQIENSSAHLDNPLDIVRWNIDKKYLRDLESKGIQILPTLWRDSIDENEINDFFEQLQAEEIVIKPCISAGAFNTFRLTPSQAIEKSSALVDAFQQRSCMIQSFSQAIIDEGEFSIFYFDGEYSHTVLKKPKTNDFRVQEEFGGLLKKVEPEAALKRHAERVLDVVGQSLLYARLDFVRDNSDATNSCFALMEAELIEPSLYFNLDPESPRRYVEAMQRRMKRLGVIE
ncbi:ATP-grasp domain-containing protein [Aliikangiella coralliicola]|uniref:Prokaryotic glutathione synthetase ATP-binding domain-containing protein n=1 Tax=Aliikangiella coralliicola TaxID=2592383 RepID=A0A545UAP2_9GAMM|nr:hypothetical protein [Aliikangiella coralliicola]TQV86542.1 hypothetical protein FLL46_16690 [Aliikangiella coralliicola]